MKQELVQSLRAFRDAITKNGHADASKFLIEADEAVTNKGALNDIDSEYEEQLFELITDIEAIENVSVPNKERFDATVELIETTLYENDED
ncbi:hypothetical protein [Parachryseolinea silvisoli]|jgi:hypothetical protein|uniref:hypothetical protein n=1 Tax=Parachryseolinea silvisoli TaxID=2873601 RepID=UPI002265D547|nr:hypothetical protein [Parachryseolinea silvisoli]MCD9017142.1 hypothetical protein [Parachryseolinea silvisoli]